MYDGLEDDADEAADAGLPAVATGRLAVVEEPDDTAWLWEPLEGTVTLLAVVLTADDEALEGAVRLTVLVAGWGFPADGALEDTVPRPPLVPVAIPAREDVLVVNTLSEPVLWRGPRQRLSLTIIVPPWKGGSHPPYHPQ